MRLFIQASGQMRISWNVGELTLKFAPVFFARYQTLLSGNPDEQTRQACFFLTSAPAVELSEQTAAINNSVWIQFGAVTDAQPAPDSRTGL